MPPPLSPSLLRYPIAQFLSPGAPPRRPEATLTVGRIPRRPHLIAHGSHPAPKPVLVAGPPQRFLGQAATSVPMDSKDMSAIDVDKHPIQDDIVYPAAATTSTSFGGKSSHKLGVLRVWQ